MTIRVLAALSLLMVGANAQDGARLEPSTGGTPTSTNGLFPKFTPTAALTYDDPSTMATNVPPVRKIADGLFEVGKVRVDSAKRAVSFPAVLNMNQGPMEYMLVTTYGKVHESIFRTDVQPFHIHTAMLLLGFKPQQQQGPAPSAAAEPNHAPASYQLKGQPVTLDFSWDEGAKQIKRTSADFLSTVTSGVDKDGGPLIKTNLQPSLKWIYNGSAIFDGRFLAQAGGSISSLITDGSALMNNIGVGHDNDDMWMVSPKNLPPEDKIVTVTIQLPLPAK